MTDTIDTRDHVLHKPTGESWLVAFVAGERLFACGWPPGSVPVSDCQLEKKVDQACRDKLLRDMAAMNDAFDARCRYARRVLGLCKCCGGAMAPGQALEQTFAGIPDFPGGAVVTMSPRGPGKLVDCMKCENCGWSVMASA